jgi:tight adherence protein B
MTNLFGANAFLVITVLVFVSMMLLLRSLYLMWKAARGPAARRMETRMQALSATFVQSRDSILRKQPGLSDVPTFEAVLRTLPVVQKLPVYIRQSGLQWSVARLLLTSAVCGMLAFSAANIVFHQAFVIDVAAGAAGALPALLYVARKRRMRLAAFERQFPDALDLLIRALRAGHAFSSGLHMVGEEMPEPIAGEFRIVRDEINFGVAMQQALLNLSERIPLTDLRYFVVAVLIQRESGGNLTEALGNLSRLVRERLKFMAKVRVLSAEGRLSAWVLGIMPFALAGALTVLNPKFIMPLWTDPIGIIIIRYTLVLMVIGALILRKIVNFRI